MDQAPGRSQVAGHAQRELLQCVLHMPPASSKRTRHFLLCAPCCAHTRDVLANCGKIPTLYASSDARPRDYFFAAARHDFFCRRARRRRENNATIFVSRPFLHTVLASRGQLRSAALRAILGTRNSDAPVRGGAHFAVSERSMPAARAASITLSGSPAIIARGFKTTVARPACTRRARLFGRHAMRSKACYRTVINQSKIHAPVNFS